MSLLKTPVLVPALVLLGRVTWKHLYVPEEAFFPVLFDTSLRVVLAWNSDSEHH